MTDEEIKVEVEEALIALGKIHPRLPKLIKFLSARQEGLIKALTLFEKKVGALDARQTRFEELGGVAILKLERERKRRVRKELREEKRLARGIEKAGEK